MNESAIQIPCSDGFTLHGTLFAGATGNGGVVVIAAALGVPRKIYASLARYLAERGFKVLSFDYRGIGDSSHGPVRGSAIRMEDWGRLDIDAVLGWAMKELKPSKLFLLGHSAGAQLAGLAVNSEKLSGMVFAAVSSAYVGHWRMPAKLAMLALMYAVVPGLSVGREFYPKLGGLSAMRVPTGVTRQWARWARTPGYLFDSVHRLDIARYGRLATPVLAFQFDDDSYAPLSAHEAILAGYPKATITRRRIKSAELGGNIGHFGYFRDRRRDTLWKETADWLLKTG
jgi:predicted alpha/beta hydrolase